MNNPYAAPQVDLGAPLAGSDETYQPKLFQARGRIGRMRYLAFNAALSLLLIPVVIVFSVAIAAMASGANSKSPLFIGLMALFVVAVLVALVMGISFGRRRLNDMGRSGWFLLLGLIPLVNFIFYLWILCASGDDGANEYGPPPAPNTPLINIAGGIMIAFIVLSVVFNVVGGMAGFNAASSTSQSSGF